MMMQHAIPMERPMMLIMLWSLSLRSNLKAIMKKLANIYGFVIFV
jgi:hypothetical protein